jgi:hypothetical protein
MHIYVNNNFNLKNESHLGLKTLYLKRGFKKIRDKGKIVSAR